MNRVWQHPRVPAIFVLKVLAVAIAMLFFYSSVESATPAWHVQGNYGGYPSPANCTTSSNYAYPGFNPDNKCYWAPHPLAMSMESVSNSVYTRVAANCNDTYNATGCTSRTTQLYPATSPIYVTAGSPVQLDWSCLPSQTVNYWVYTGQTYIEFIGWYYFGYWTTHTLNFSNAAVLTRSNGTTVNTGGAMQGSVTENPTSNTTYTLNCGAYTSSIQVQIVPSFTAPLILELSANAENVPPNTPVTLTYNIQNLRSQGTCSITGPSGPLLTRTMPVSNFNYTGGNQSWTAPAGISTVTAKLWGAGGGLGCQPQYTTCTGGGGGFTVANFLTTPGTPYTVIVGQGGVRGGGATYGGGGATPYSLAGSGGGRSAVRTAGGSEIITAGGGGGFGAYGPGGGGGTDGGQIRGSSQQCNQVSSGWVDIRGGSQTQGGGPVSGPGNRGSQYTGAPGWACYYGGGGGGGYYGGGGASYSGGSGGSGRCDPSLAFCATIPTGQGAPAQVGDSDYPGGTIGYGSNNGHGAVKLMGTFSGAINTPALSATATYTLSCTVGGSTQNVQETVVVSAQSCPAGSHKINPPACDQCEVGYEMQAGVCVPVPVSCPAGSHKINPPACDQCEVGYEMQGGNCVLAVCPGAHQTNYPACDQCESGYSMQGGVCTAIVPAIIGLFEAVPARVAPNSATSLRWSTTGMDTCTLSRNDSATPVSTALSSSGTNATITRQTIFTLQCYAGGASSVRKITVNLLPIYEEI